MFRKTLSEEVGVTLPSLVQAVWESPYVLFGSPNMLSVAGYSFSRALQTKLKSQKFYAQGMI